MPLDIPSTAEQVISRSKTDVQRSVNGGFDPFNKNNVMSAMITADANRIFDFYIQLEQALKESLPDTADLFLERWAGIFGITRQPGGVAVGNIIATGVLPGNIPIATTFSTTDGKTYKVVGSGPFNLAAVNISPTSITRSGDTATVTTPNPHNLANNILVTITGANEPQYNIVDAEIIVISTTQFTYTVNGSPTSPATGSIVISFISAVITIESEGFGQDQNQESGSILTAQTALVNVNSEFGTAFGGITGGVDQGTNEELRAALIDRIQNPVANFNVAAIVKNVKETPGITRVFVQESRATIGIQSIQSQANLGNIINLITDDPHNLASGDTINITGASPAAYNVTNEFIVVNSPTSLVYVLPVDPGPNTVPGQLQSTVPPGSARIFFMRDNDQDPIPNAGQVTVVRNKLLSEIKPANTADSDITVAAPIPVSVDFTFTEIIPTTATMKDSVKASLRQFFDEKTSVGVTIDKNAYEAAIFNTIDSVTGELVISFALSAPTTDITIPFDSIGILGVVTI